MQIILDGIVGSGDLWLDIMRIICGDASGKSMVDLGCHRAPYTPLLGFSDRIYVDIQDRPLDHKEEQKWFVQSDIIEYMKKCNKVFDVCIASDVVEHLSEENGRALLQLMEFKSEKQIVFTPIGPWMLSKDDNPDSHRSAWYPILIPEYSTIVLPHFHPSLGIGAFFGVRCSLEETQRIIKEIKAKYDKSISN